MYLLKDKDELIINGSQLREYRDIIERETILKIANKEIKIDDWRR